MKTSAKSVGIKEAAVRFGWPLKRMKVCELTLGFTCNARCVFCYSSPDLEAWKGKEGLSFRKAASCLLSSYKDGARMVQFIGGEPTVYEDLPKLIKLAATIGYPAIQLVSNGLRLADRDYARELADAGLNTAVLSIHSAKAASHEAITGIKGSFRKVMRAAENLISRGVYLNTGTAVTGMNYKAIPGLVKFVTGTLGVDSCHIIATHYLGAAYENRARLRISYKKQLPYVEESIAAFHENMPRPAFSMLSNYLPCLLPGRENLMGDWKYPEKDDDLFLPGEEYRGTMYTMITENLRTKGPACRRCVYNSVCAGYEKGYAALYGVSEFKPVLSRACQLGPDPLYS